VYKTTTSTYVIYAPTLHTSHNFCQDYLTVCATRQRKLVLTPTNSGVRNFNLVFVFATARKINHEMPSEMYTGAEESFRSAKRIRVM